MNKIDREIIKILKDIFQLRRVRPLNSDHNMRLWLIRMTFAVSLFGIIGRVVVGFTGRAIPAEYSAVVNTPIVIFFTLLFLHINNEVEESSVIIFVLTWVALVLGLYV
ncbi:hypothetical protein R50076_15440 [Gilvimarinus japonicus]